ncbi:MAG: hypothetical protein ACRCZF_16700, partial [Gemmataceae bacterium]
ITDLSQAITMNADTMATPLSYRAMAQAYLGENAQALADVNEALQLEPLGMIPMNAKAWLLACCRDEKIRNPKLAIELADKLCDMTCYKVGGYLDTLAMAHAAAGDFASAVRWQELALRDKRFLEAAGEEPAARLKLYQNKQAYRAETAK